MGSIQSTNSVPEAIKGNIQTVVSDVYALANGVNPPTEQSTDIISRFGDECKALLARFVDELNKERESNRLRPSNLGVPARKLWFQINETLRVDGQSPSSQPETPKDDPLGTPPKPIYDVPYRPITFLYGSLAESLILALVRLTGKHTITNEQMKVSLGGIEGSIDCDIDKVRVDVKSASPYSFNEVKNGSLSSNDPLKDPFGYRDQLSFYRHAEPLEGSKEVPGKDAGWLTFDKSSGELAFTSFGPMEGMKSRKAVEALIQERKDMLSQPEPPKELCYPPEPFGKSGNESLNKLCKLCPFKFKCYPDVRLFQYKSGIEYLTKVVKIPEVEEIERKY